jgi:hypothetical protein
LNVQPSMLPQSPALSQALGVIGSGATRG